jgi:hypothetical protein
VEEAVVSSAIIPDIVHSLIKDWLLMKRSLLTLLFLLSLPITVAIAQESGSSLAAHVKALKSNDEASARAAYEPLSKGGAVALELILPLLSHPNKEVRLRGTMVVSLIVCSTRKEIEDAKERLKIASEALQKCKGSYETVLKGLEDSNADVRAQSAATLALVSPDREKVQTANRLRKLLGDKNNKVRTGAAQGLGHLGAVAGIAVEDLKKALKDKNSRCRAASAKALGRIGGASKSAEAGLEAALKDKNGTVRKAAERALKAIRESK